MKIPFLGIILLLVLGCKDPSAVKITKVDGLPEKIVIHFSTPILLKSVTLYHCQNRYFCYSDCEVSVKSEHQSKSLSAVEFIDSELFNKDTAICALTSRERYRFDIESNRGAAHYYFRFRHAGKKFVAEPAPYF